ISVFSHSTRLLAATTLRNVLGTRNLAEILSERESISHAMQTNLDHATEPWGVKVERVEIKDVRLPQNLQRAMAAEAEATREGRAKVIAAEAEMKSSRALKEAADIIVESPAALQLRYMQTLQSISQEKNSTIIFPIPVDIISSLLVIRYKPPVISEKIHHHFQSDFSLCSSGTCKPSSQSHRKRIPPSSFQFLLNYFFFLVSLRSETLQSIHRKEFHLIFQFLLFSLFGSVRYMKPSSQYRKRIHHRLQFVELSSGFSPMKLQSIKEKNHSFQSFVLFPGISPVINSVNLRKNSHHFPIPLNSP
ncbi:hypothetical protein WDU94_007730, partial [Cyamophila willieti]